MKVQHTWKYLTLLAALGFWGCSPSKQLAGESDDLYGSSSDAPAYASTQRESRPVERTRTASQRYEDSKLNANPDYYNEETAALYDDEYYSDITARKVQRGISPDPGWSTTNYNDGFADGYNMAFMNSRWNRWGWNSPFYGGLGLGIGVGMSPWGWNSWRYGGMGMYDPFYGGFGGMGGFGGFYDPFMAYSPFGFGYGFNSFYNPYMYGGGFGFNRPVVVVNNYDRIGANRATYGARRGASSDRYNGSFVNTPRSYNNNSGGRRSGELNSSNNTANNNTYYSRPNNNSGNATNSGYGAGRANSRGADYYYGGSGNSGRANANSGNSSARPSYSAPPSNSDYYAAPRQNSRGSYTPPSNSGSRYSAPQQQPTRTYQAPTRSYEAPQRTYSPPSQPSYSSPSYGGSRGGGGSSGGGGYSGGGGSRGPR
ncbi:hypothetical protein [Larkinella harenae]